MEENPLSANGQHAILEHLRSFVPEREGQVMPILCSGEGLSIEDRAKRARADVDTTQRQLRGLVECPGESHKETVLLQVITRNVMLSRSISLSTTENKKSSVSGACACRFILLLLWNVQLLDWLEFCCILNDFFTQGYECFWSLRVSLFLLLLWNDVQLLDWLEFCCILNDFFTQGYECFWSLRVSLLFLFAMKRCPIAGLIRILLYFKRLFHTGMNVSGPCVCRFLLLLWNDVQLLDWLEFCCILNDFFTRVWMFLVPACVAFCCCYETMSNCWID